MKNNISKELRRSFDRDSYQNADSNEEQKSGLSPWFPKRANSKQKPIKVKGEAGINVNEQIEPTKHFLKQIKRNRKSLFMKTNRLDSKEKKQQWAAQASAYACLSQEKQVFENEKTIKNEVEHMNTEENASLLMYPFTGMDTFKEKKKSFRNRFTHQRLKTEDNYRQTLKQKQVSPIFLYAKKEPKRINEFYSPDKSIAVTTIYGKSFKTHRQNQLKMKNDKERQKIVSEHKKLNLEEIYQLIQSKDHNEEIGNKNDVQKCLKKSKRFRNQTGSLYKPYQPKIQSFENIEDGNEIHSLKKMHAPVYQPRYKRSDDWLIPRHHMHKQKQAQKSIHKTIYI